MKKLIAVVTTIFLSGCSVFGIRSAEEPSYDVHKDYGHIQIRHYPALVVAQTEVNADYKDSSNQGFQRLAGYIFGNNKKQQKIDMTAPVIQQQTTETIAMTAPVIQQKSGTVWLMAFVLPQGYSVATAPIPIDAAVLLKDIPEKKVAVIKYTGSLSEQAIDDKAEELSTWLSKHNYKAVSAPRSAAYDPPWTLPFLRRNEVHIDIDF
ncbi:MAG: heme-binding protein [Methylobacter sp.]|nr:heme-binding protein [Methylobacter sp.]MDP2097104.1 heme-binding protein [Methylobacter sp.]MDP2428276.1 heme-binding protein [Methylobacter sp.]MDP3056381.1 heme-binding protein [Methylobacter sp.]MDP3361024.1 heme-binding protein [Methylobacter sp.]